MPKKLFGLDIGSTSIKAVEVSSEKNKKRLLKAGLAPTPSAGLVSESDLDQQLIAGAIKKLVEVTKFETNLVNVSLPESQVFTRVIEMPFLTEKELSSAIKWEAEQYIPLPVASVSLDWEILRTDKEKSKTEVLLVGAPTRLISKYEKILEMAGLVPVFMETEILAAARSLIGSSQDAPSAMIIEIGAKSTSLGVFRDNKLEVAFSIPTAGMAIERLIAQEFGFETKQAEEYKKTYGFNEEALEGKIAAAIKPVLLSLLTEVKKALSFYQGKNPNEKEIKRIILSGGGAKLPGLIPFFTQNLGIETGIANPWKELIVDQNIFKNQILDAPFYSIATGLDLQSYG